MLCHMNSAKSQNGNCRRSVTAFTLLELLVILGMLSVLVCVLSPALARTKPGTNAAQCLANLRHLIGAWTMYADDVGGKLAPNRDGGYTGKAPSDASWAGGWLDYTANSDNTNIALLMDHNQFPYSAYLGPYLKTASVFKCPSDHSVARTYGGQRMARVRSVSMNNRVGDMTRSWSGLPTYRLYRTMSSIVAPHPSQLFVLNDEREDSINDGVFMVDPDTPGQMVSFPAGYHNASATYAFADSHVELHRWQDPRTLPVLVPDQLIPLNVNLPGNPDVEWIHQHCSAKQ